MSYIDMKQMALEREYYKFYMKNKNKNKTKNPKTKTS